MDNEQYIMTQYKEDFSKTKYILYFVIGKIILLEYILKFNCVLLRLPF